MSVSAPHATAGPSPAGEAAYDFLDHQLLASLARLPVLPRGLMEGSFSGLHRSPHRGSSVEFAEYRKYVPGDDVRYVDWRVYAKTDRFYLKEFEADTNLRLFLVLDGSASMAFRGQQAPRSKFQFARQVAATLAYLAVNQGDHVGLQVFSDAVQVDIPPRGNPAHLKAVFDTLAATVPKGKTDLVGVLHDLAERCKRRALVVVLSDFFTDPVPLMDCFHHMHFRKHDLAVWHLLDREELDFAFDRPIRFVDLEGSATVITEPNAVRADYLNAVQHYLDVMRRGCAEHGADYRLVRTADPLETVLSDFLVERLRR